MDFAAEKFFHVQREFVMKDFCVKEFLQRGCSVFLFWESFAQKVSCDRELTVDAICIRISAYKSFWIRQVMSAPVDSRVLNDGLHFDTLCSFMISFSVNCLYLPLL